MRQLVEELEEIGKMKMVLEENGDLDDDEVVVHQPPCFLLYSPLDIF